MERRDFVEKQIDELGRALSAVFNKVFKETNQKVPITDDEIIQTFQDDLSIDLEKASKLSQDELMEFLIGERGYSFENLEKLAKVISLISSNKDGALFTDDALTNLELAILNYLTENDKNFSFERKMRIDYLKNLSQ